MKKRKKAKDHSDWDVKPNVKKSVSRKEYKHSKQKEMDTQHCRKDNGNEYFDEECTSNDINAHEEIECEEQIKEKEKKMKTTNKNKNKKDYECDKYHF